MALPESEMRAESIVFLATGGVPSLFELGLQPWLSEPER